MKNILSYQPGTIFSGKELNDFFSNAIKDKTSKAKIAIKYISHFRFKDNRMYQMVRGRMRESEPECPMFVRVQ